MNTAIANASQPSQKTISWHPFHIPNRPHHRAIHRYTPPRYNFWHDCPHS